jgi:CheY-like chemotaxis protein
VAVRLDRAAAGYRLSVRDSGVGIEPRFLPHLFEAFRQADGSPSREHGGLGLGLAIAKQLVELHGGTITAQSHGLGRGATFEVSLPSLSMPAWAGDHATAPVTPAAVAADDSLLRSLHVLVVDDEADARTLIEAALSQYGATVTTAGSAAEALASIDRVVPDVLLSDIGMPHEDGYSLIRRLRARPAEKGGSVPAVALTAYASDGDRDAAMSAGFQAHVSKPFDPREVASLVARLGRGAPTRA